MSYNIEDLKNIAKEFAIEVDSKDTVQTLIAKLKQDPLAKAKMENLEQVEENKDSSKSTTLSDWDKLVAETKAANKKNKK